MSNPAVTKLRKININKSSICLDDNIGESIHLHIDDIRLDFTVKEFKKLCDELCEVINSLANVEGFDIRDVDPVYFECMLWENIIDLKRVEKCKVKLSDMLCPANDGTLVKLADSRLVKALNGNEKANDMPKSSDLISQTGRERLAEIHKSIKTNGYPHDGQYIILYNDDNIIQDGQHRAASLYMENGDQEVEVQRFIFDNYITRSTKKPFEFTLIGQLIFPFKHPMAYLRRKKASIINSYNKKIQDFKLKNYMKNNKAKYLKSLKIIEEK